MMPRDKLLPVSVVATGILIVTIVVYFPLRHAGFVAIDDGDYLSANRMVQAGITWSGVKWAFTTGHAGNWHPVTWLSHMMDVQLFGFGAVAPHLINVALHSANAALTFLVLVRLTRAVWPSGLVAGLFALHPLRVESVAWVAERKDVLSAFFFLWAILAYVRWTSAGKLRWYFFALLSFALALMSKPMAVTLPFVLLLLDWWPLGRMQEGKTGQLWRLGLEKLPFWALSCFASVVTLVVQNRGGAVTGFARFSLLQRSENAVVAYAEYLRATFWPSGLAIFYPHPLAWPVGTLITATLTLVAITLFCCAFLRRLPFLAFGWFWFLGMLLPTIGLVQVGGQSHADRYTYLPSIGLYLAIIWATASGVSLARLSSQVLAASAVTVLIAFGLITERQVSTWQDNESLFGRAISVTEGNYVAHNGLGLALLEKRRVEEAILEFNAATAIRPDFTIAHYNLGTALLEAGKVGEAIRELQIAASRDTESPDAFVNLGNALLRSGELDAAVASYKRALVISPDQVETLNNLGSALALQGHIEEASRNLERALALDPSHQKTLQNLGDLRVQHGDIDGAVKLYKRAIVAEPASADIHNSLAGALMAGGQFDEAILEFRKTIALAPNLAAAHGNLALAYLRVGRVPEAIAEMDSTLQFAPQDAATLANLAWVLATSPDDALRNGLRAVEYAERANRILDGADAWTLRSLSAAYAETGRFTEARIQGEKALRLATSRHDEKLASAIVDLLNRLPSGLPYRDLDLGPRTGVTPSP